ncbi:hypothetical protein A7975_27250 [Bacillus sp. FJAT-26390]|nr:hypothetical protein A7975_27250 [Bacillus sp. FJAT-26390]
MSDIAENLKSILKRKGISQKELAEMTDISTSTISDYITAKRLMAPSITQSIAEALKVDASEISPLLESVDASISENINLPIVGKISCGSGIVAFEYIDGYESTPRSWLNGGDYFYLKAKGNSMTGARIHEGDLLLIRKQDEVEDGEIAAVLINEEAVLKKVYKQNDSIVLNSMNSDYAPIVCKLDENIRIIGKLKKVVITF